jgi:hypothetical protein
MMMSAANQIEVKMKNPSQETKIALLEQSIGHINQTLMRFEKKIDSLDDKVDKKFNTLNEKFDDARKDIRSQLEKMDNRLWVNFYWILGTMFSLSCAGAAILAKGFGWFN